MLVSAYFPDVMFGFSEARSTSVQERLIDAPLTADCLDRWPIRDQFFGLRQLGDLCLPAIHGFEQAVNHTGTARADPLHGPGCLKASYDPSSCSGFELSSSHCAVAESSRTGAVDAPAGSRHGASDSCMSACLPRGVASDRAGSSIASLHRRLAPERPVRCEVCG